MDGWVDGAHHLSQKLCLSIFSNTLILSLIKVRVGQRGMKSQIQEPYMNLSHEHRPELCLGCISRKDLRKSPLAQGFLQSSASPLEIRCFCFPEPPTWASTSRNTEQEPPTPTTIEPALGSWNRSAYVPKPPFLLWIKENRSGSSEVTFSDSLHHRVQRSHVKMVLGITHPKPECATARI